MTATWRAYFTALLVTGLAPLPAHAIPYFAHRYRVTCQQCHVSVPKLNGYGEAFVANGYSLPDLVARGAFPISLWSSARSDYLPGVSGAEAKRLRAYMNRVEAISGGRLVVPWLTYFVEWRPVSQEPRGDGSLRDRSGRFEDIFVTAAAANAEFTVGQFRQLAQVDVSRRLGMSEPLLHSATLPGEGGGSAREQSLRGFSFSGRSPAVRAAWIVDRGDNWRWTSSVGVPLPGEFSLPLNDDARVEASNEIEWRAKGVVLESFARRQLASFGMHAFVGDGERYAANLVATGQRGDLLWTTVAGAARSAGATRGQWSLEGEYVPLPFLAMGGRVEDRAADGARVALLPFVNAHFPGTRFTIRLTVERRIQRGRDATFIELGTVF